MRWNLRQPTKSLWEIALKYSLGKLDVDFDIKNIPDYCNRMGFDLIPLEPVEALKEPLINCL